jgi:PRC-barrel domain
LEKAGVIAMRHTAQLPATSELSYLDASKVTSPAGVLSELDVLSAEGQRLGSIEGVVIDAAARHVRYLCVRLSGWFGGRRYLVQADQLGQIDGERKALRLLVDLKNAVVQGLDAAALRKFSDDDLLAAIFSPRAA